MENTTNNSQLASPGQSELAISGAKPLKLTLSRRQVLSGALAIMLAALLWSLDGLFIRPRFYILPAGLIVFWEHFLGFIILSPFIFLNLRKIKTLSRKSWGAVIWISLFGGLLGTLMITKAFFAAFAGETTFATVVILQKLQPVFALLLAAVVLKEKLPRNFYLWTGVAIIASYFLAFAKEGLDFTNIDWRNNAAIFAFLAAFAFGSSTVFGKRLANHLDYRATAALRFGVTSILALALILIIGDFFAFNQITRMHWGFLVVIVLTSGAGAMFIYYFGLRRVSASAATILELFWPFSAVILDYIFNKNFLTGGQIVAALVLLLAFYKVSSLNKFQKVSFRAKVIAGQGRGRRLGFPTANLDKTDLDIPHGIYAVNLDIKSQKYSGVMHFGFRDVFNEPVSLEILIKDFSEDIYGQEIGVTVIRKIREVQKFSSSTDLQVAITKDLTTLRD